MGAGESKPVESIVEIARTAVPYSPPLGPPVRGNPIVYMDIKLGRYGEGTPLGRIMVELKADVCPKTAENFRQLCLNPEGQGFVNSRYHRIIPGFMCQGGDFTADNGTGGRSIYGARFADENFKLRHVGVGILSMANAGPNTNGSQFFLCVTPTPFLDGKHTVFGQVVDGYSVVKAMEACGSRSGETAHDVMIAKCGEVDTSAAAGGVRTATARATGRVAAAHAAAPAAALSLGARGGASAGVRVVAAPAARRAALAAASRAPRALRARAGAALALATTASRALAL